MSLTFEWDQNKSDENEREHGITFEEAKTIFNDPDHSDDEYRYIDIGFFSKGRVLIVYMKELGLVITRAIRCQD